MNKKIYLFTIFFINPAFGYFTTPESNSCGNYTSFHAIFEPSIYTCNSGYYLPANSDTCVVCTYGHTCNGGILTFNRYIDQGISVSQHTCNSGYFLPANTDRCQPCPNGYTCNGGTFEFNTTIAQGLFNKQALKTQDISNGCSYNIAHVFKAKFVPNTVSLTWDDNNGNSVQSTCTYGEIITLPPTPTRAGYTFNGWTVQNN